MLVFFLLVAWPAHCPDENTQTGTANEARRSLRQGVQTIFFPLNKLHQSIKLEAYPHVARRNERMDDGMDDSSAIWLAC